MFFWLVFVCLVYLYKMTRLLWASDYLDCQQCSMKDSVTLGTGVKTRRLSFLRFFPPFHFPFVLGSQLIICHFRFHVILDSVPHYLTFQSAACTWVLVFANGSGSNLHSFFCGSTNANAFTGHLSVFTRGVHLYNLKIWTCQKLLRDCKNWNCPSTNEVCNKGSKFLSDLCFKKLNTTNLKTKQSI